MVTTVTPFSPSPYTPRRKDFTFLFRRRISCTAFRLSLIHISPEEDRELRRNFPQYVRALAEVYGVLNKL